MEESSRNESSMSAPGTPLNGSLARAFDRYRFAPGRHWSSISWSISLSAHRRSFDERACILIDYMIMEQSVTIIHLLPHECALFCHIA